MKIRIRYFFGCLVLGVAAIFAYKKATDFFKEKKRQELAETLEPSASKNVQILENILEIDYLGEKRTLAIYLPAGYTADTAAYSVIYFLDGQSLFDQKILPGNEWQLDEVLDSLGKISGEQSILVGIYSAEDRFDEYRPLPETNRWLSDRSFHGDKHADWIVNKLKPWIDLQYRTKKAAESTLIGGSSLGGLMAYFMLMKYPEVFGAGIVMSPSFWVNEDIYSLHLDNPELYNQKIYFNAGELEPRTIENAERMRQTLLEFGMPREHLKFDLVQGLGHSHLVWREGFKRAYPWIIRNP